MTTTTTFPDGSQLQVRTHRHPSGEATTYWRRASEDQDWEAVPVADLLDLPTPMTAVERREQLLQRRAAGWSTAKLERKLGASRSEGPYRRILTAELDRRKAGK